MTLPTANPQTHRHASIASPGTCPPSRLRVSFTVTAWIAALFCLLICAGMLYQHSVASQQDPWKSPQLLKLKEQLRAAPADDNLKNEIRRLDLEFRQRYVRRLSLNRTGAWLLVGGIIVMLLAFKQTLALQAVLPTPRRQSDAAEQASRHSAQARWSVAGIGAVVAAGLATIAFAARSPLPNSASDLDKLLGRGTATEDANQLPSLAEFAANWPRFRGFDGSGVIFSTKGLPITWDDKTDEGVIWKSPLTGPGFNSPIVWSNRVFVSSGDDQQRTVFCFDAVDGKEVWRREIRNVPGSPAQQPKVPTETSFAAATMACDGQRVFAIFANGDLAALTMEGAPVWSKNVGVPKILYGYATSLAVWPGKLLVQFDQDEGAPGGSKLLALDAATGRVLWERSRQVLSSWASPIIIEAAGKTQIITLGQPWLISYSLANGNELWRAELLEGEITPSPVFVNGMVLAVGPSSKLVALQPDGSGDVTRTRVLWSQEDYLPDVTSPVSNGELVFTVLSSGTVACFDAKDGKLIWQHELSMEVQSSPAIAGDRLYILSTKGVAVVLATAREFKELGRGTLDDRFYASPAFAGGKMFLRGNKNVWCLGMTTHE